MLQSWQSLPIGLNLSLDTAIALAYAAIFIILVYIKQKRGNLPFNGIFLLFTAFIFLSATNYAIDIWRLWHSSYSIWDWLKLQTALVSLSTAIALVVKIPQILTSAKPIENRIDQQLTAKITELERQLEQQRTTICQQKQFLRHIYDDVREAIFIVDVTADGKFYYQGFNPAAHKLTGIEDVVNKTPSQIFPPEDAARIERCYRECLQLKKTITYEECLSFQGKDTWWLTSLNPVEDEAGIHRLVGTSLNISQRKQAEIELDRDKQFLQALLDNLSDGIVSCDRHGVITLFNQASKQFHGVAEQAISADRWAEYYDLYLSDGKIMPQEDIPLFRALKGESVRDIEMKIIPKQGKPRILLANGDPIVDSNGEKIGAIVAMRDITERQQAQQAIARLNNQLEARVQQRTAQLEKLNAVLLTTTNQLEKRNQELDRFAYVTSHDLKAPLRAIANLSQWIEEDLADKLDDETRYKMNLLQGRVQRLENLINGLLAYSRVGRVKFDSSEVEVGKMLTEILDSLDIREHFQIEIQGEMPTFVTELIPLQQVFSNLISNAIKHSDCQQGKIIISVIERANYYEFTVADNGKGIDPKYHDRIFTIFQTLESRDTKESTGIGLAIVKKAVEDRGGQIKVESRLGAGSTFRFTWQKEQNN